MQYNNTGWAFYLCFFATGLLAGIVILQTPQAGKRKKYIKSVAFLLFIALLTSGLYQNIRVSSTKEKDQTECTLSDYERLCQAKCYCGFDNATYSQTSYYKRCQGFKICNTCREVHQMDDFIPPFCNTMKEEDFKIK